MFNKTTFFTYVRRAPFGGLKTEQVQGCEQILKHWEDVGLTDLRWLAYILATVYHETAHTMQPIEEFGKGRGKKYGRKYYGRGLVQITWEDNYKKFGIDSAPEKALEWATALNILFDGMIKGLFTGKRLSQYFNKKANDPVGARKIVNGTDKAELIKTYYDQFLGALKAAETSTPQPKDVSKEAAQPDDIPAGQSNWFKSLIGGLSLSSITGVFTSIDNPYALGGVVLATLVGGVFVYLVYTGRINFSNPTAKASLNSISDSGPMVVMESQSLGSEASGPEGRARQDKDGE